MGRASAGDTPNAGRTPRRHRTNRARDAPCRVGAVNVDGHVAHGRGRHGPWTGDALCGRVSMTEVLLAATLVTSEARAHGDGRRGLRRCIPDGISGRPRHPSERGTPPGLAA